jgi:hypothetical protein
MEKEEEGQPLTLLKNRLLVRGYLLLQRTSKNGVKTSESSAKKSSAPKHSLRGQKASARPTLLEELVI